ncbi:MAG: hypothetical protein EHM23_31400 [Acidobacteria bacterium]|nr:MAG: hypothetical protein EHM23_31400 [Acidobacteriota bacterium]
MNTRKPEQTQPCEICGHPESIEFADQWICEDCYRGRGSCCPEFGKDDLWTFDEDEERDVKPEEVCLKISEE